MRAFSTLSNRGQTLRLRQLALQGLEQYELEVVRVRLVTNHLNGLFRVDAADGLIYMVRISHPTWRTDMDLQVELAWLCALDRDTDIGAPVPLPARDGSLFTTLATACVPEPRRCVLFSWIPGVLLEKRLSKPNLFSLGVLAAQLHAHAAKLRLPAGITARTLNGIYVRGETVMLYDDRCAGYFTPESRTVFEHVSERVDMAFKTLYADPAGLRLIHNDLHQENVHVYRGRLRPLDFEDVVWGYPVQDIAATFYDLLDYAHLDQGRYSELRDAFQRGYTSQASWPEAYPGQIDTFIAARQLWRANWVACNEPDYLERHIGWMAARFQAFLRTGSFPQ